MDATTALVTVEMTVRHGGNRTVTATAETITSALAEILTTPVGIGYAPKVGTPGFAMVLQELSLTGASDFGWAEYRTV